MNAHQGYQTDAVTLADAQRVQTTFVLALEGYSAVSRGFYRATTTMFLGHLGNTQSSAGQIILNADNLLSGMVQICQGRTDKHASSCISVLGRYLRAIHVAGLTSTDLMADFREDHRRASWISLTRALQSPDPAEALASLKSPPPVGPLHYHVQQYLELQESLGKRFRTQRYALLDLDRYVRDRGLHCPEAVDATMIEQWISKMTCTPRVRVHKTRSVRRFFDYLVSLQVVNKNPLGPARFVEARPDPVAFRPFIFDREQIASVLAHVEKLPQDDRFPLRGLTCHTMLALLYVLGLRHGEVLRLSIGDLDLGRQTLLIAETKFHKSRLVPFGPKLGLRLKAYLSQRRTLFPTCDEGDPLFVVRQCRTMCYETLMNVFRAGLRHIGIVGSNDKQLPRLHDLRHSFAVHCLLRWYKEGVDVQNRLLVLATFMGHVNIVSTQVYLTITSDLLNEANLRFHRHFGCQFDAEVQP